MRAIQMDKYRGEATLREVPVPAIRADELLLRVRAAAVNPLDGLILRGEVRLHGTVGSLKMPYPLRYIMS